MKKAQLFGGLIVCILFAFSFKAGANVRIKDATQLAGIPDEQVVGYGLIVGLNGTGDGNKSVFTVNSIVSMLEKFGVTVPASDVKVENVAAVIVTAQIQAFTPVGTKMDVMVSSLSDASSLEGGQLLMTPLRGQDGNVYAVAQGPVSIGGFNIEAGAGNVIRRNHSTVGRIPDGAIIRRQPAGELTNNDMFKLSLHNPDFQSATNIVNHINFLYQMKLASALDSREIVVKIPPQYSKNHVAFIAEIGNMEVTLDKLARVVINERTGTVIIGGKVIIDEVAIAHGNLQVEISAKYGVSQPMSFGQGQSVVVPEIETIVKDKEARLFAMRKSSTVSDIASALNELGVTPRDIVAIFQALKKAGALNAELVIM
ncbi:flagellar basal body P-ring protein FlgI [bacterium]|nr:flagellar basal body P-ring protein FlgI [bacterium]